MPFRIKPRAALCAVLLLAGSAAVANEPAPRLVRVVGQGEVSALPDQASVTLGAEARNASLEQARAEVSATVERVLSLCRDLKIDSRHVNATRLRVQPEYSWSEKDRKRLMLGYIVSRQINVELHDLEKLGPLLERAVDAGVNQVNGPSLDSSKREDLEREAMARAVADARLNAETLAKAAGARLGEVRKLDVSGRSSPVPVHGARIALADAGASNEVGYQPGELKFTATVAAEYDLQP